MAASTEVNVKASEKVKDRTSIRLSNIPKDFISCYKDTCTSMFNAALLTMARKWNYFRFLSTNEWIRKMWYICTI